MDRIMVYADGAVRGNQFKDNLGAWAFKIIYKDKSTEKSSVHANCTNNQMELVSCLEALKTIKKRMKPITVTMDSQYVIRGINEWMKNWANNGWKNSKKQDIANKDMWLDLYLLLGNFNDIEFVHCKGHADNEGNNYVDKKCNEAMDKFEEFCKNDKMFA